MNIALRFLYVCYTSFIRASGLPWLVDSQTEPIYVILYMSHWSTGIYWFSKFWRPIYCNTIIHIVCTITGQSAGSPGSCYKWYSHSKQNVYCYFRLYFFANSVSIPTNLVSVQCLGYPLTNHVLDLTWDGHNPQHTCSLQEEPSIRFFDSVYAHFIGTFSLQWILVVSPSYWPDP